MLSSPDLKPGRICCRCCCCCGGGGELTDCAWRLGVRSDFPFTILILHFLVSALIPSPLHSTTMVNSRSTSVRPQRTVQAIVAQRDRARGYKIERQRGLQPRKKLKLQVRSHSTHFTIFLISTNPSRNHANLIRNAVFSLSHLARPLSHPFAWRCLVREAILSPLCRYVISP